MSCLLGGAPARLRRLLAVDGLGVSTLVVMAFARSKRVAETDRHREVASAMVAIAGFVLAIPAVLIASRAQKGERDSSRGIPLALISTGAVINTVGAFGIVVDPAASRVARMSSIVLLIGGDILSAGYARQLTNPEQPLSNAARSTWRDDQYVLDRS